IINSHTFTNSTDFYGAINNSGTLKATVGANSINGAAITNSTVATLEVTGSGVTLDIDQNSTVTNTGLMEAISGGDLVLNTAVVTNIVGASTDSIEIVDSSSKLELQSATIDGGNVTNHGTLEAVSGTGVNGNVINNA